MLGYNTVILARWARLYQQTEAEKALEPAIAAMGLRYRVQHPFWSIGAFADFTLPDRRLVIEVDGAEHRSRAGRERDEKRTDRLNRLGWRVWRCTNDEALGDPRGTVERLKKYLETIQLPQKD